MEYAASQRISAGLNNALSAACDRAANGDRRMRDLEIILNSAMQTKDELGNIKVSAQKLQDILTIYKAIDLEISNTFLRNAKALDERKYSDEAE